MSIILDVLIVVVVLGSIYFSYKRGFIETVLSLVGTIASYILAYTFSKPLAQLLYETPFATNLIDKINLQIENLIQENIDSAQVNSTQAITNIIESLQENFQSDLLNNINIEDIPSINVDNISQVLSEEFVIPMIFTTMTALSFVLIFIVSSFLIKVAIKVLNIAKYIPVIKGVNSSLGAILGALIAIIWSVIIVLVVNFTVDASTNELEYLNQDIINETYIFKNLSNIISNVDLI